MDTHAALSSSIKKNNNEMIGVLFLIREHKINVISLIVEELRVFKWEIMTRPLQAKSILFGKDHKGCNAIIPYHIRCIFLFQNNSLCVGCVPSSSQATFSVLYLLVIGNAKTVRKNLSIWQNRFLSTLEQFVVHRGDNEDRALTFDVVYWMRNATK